MPEPSITDVEVNDLCEKLNGMELSDAQRTLLDGILKIAWDATAADDALEAGFDGSFEPGQAALLISYHSAPAMSAQMIGRTVTGSTGAAPQMIGRMISRHVNP
jgi:hypothetical protein